MVRAGLGFLVAADAAELPGEVQAQCLAGFEDFDAMSTAARAQMLAAFGSARGYLADGAYSPRMWLFHRTRVTRGCAAGHAGWARRAAAHPRVLAALGAAQISVSWARSICDWNDRLPGECRDKADEILLGAAGRGVDLWDLTRLAGEMYEKSRPKDPRTTPAGTSRTGRCGWQATFGGAGVLSGDLTPECAAVIGTVLGALSAPAGAGDTRSHEQRYHDALAEAMRRLVAAGLVPDRAGQPARVVAHVSLADLLELDADSVLLDQWVARVRAQWAGFRAAASVTPGDGGAWLDGAAAEGFACDAAITPVVTGDINTAVLEDLVRLCVELAGHGPGHGGPGPAGGEDGTGGEGGTTGKDGTARGEEETAGPVPPTGRGREALEKAVIGKAVELLSGPGRAGLVPAPPAARRPARRSEPAPRRRLQRERPGRDPPRGPAPGPALPLGRRLPAARRGMRDPPRQAQVPRRQDQRQGLRAAVLVPPPRRDPPVGLDAGPASRRHHHRLEPGPIEGAAQPRPARPRRVTPRAANPSRQVRRPFTRNTG